jgi:cytochrome c peroxidase
MRVGKLILTAALVWAGTLSFAWRADLWDGSTVYAHDRDRDDRGDRSLDRELARVLRDSGFTGKIESTLERRLGRRLDADLADLGRLLFFDTSHSLHQDNTCAGCHSPSNGFGDSQPIAIGVDNNGTVGPHRAGPRNQRRSPMVINNAFYPKLMWNGRFSAPSGDPFDNSGGFLFPSPEGIDAFPPGGELDKRGVTHLLQAQAHIPPTETVEVAGFNNFCEQEGDDSPFCQFDHTGQHGLGLPEPVEDPETGSFFRNDPIRNKSLRILNSIDEYRRLFGRSFRSVRRGGPIDFDMFGLAIAEFEMADMTFADAPIDRFARGDRGAMTASQKRGALLFFGEAKCAGCHKVSGASNEMFSDFENHVIGVPQIFPIFGWPTSNMIYDGPDSNEDFGLEQVSGESSDRYHFRTAPLRNLKLAPAYMHNGAFTQLDDAIRHHLNVWYSALTYNPARAGVPADLHNIGPIFPVLARLDRKLHRPIHLTNREFKDLVEFVSEGLYDAGAGPENLCRLVPGEVPSGVSVLEFEQCEELEKKFRSKHDRHDRHDRKGRGDHD